MKNLNSFESFKIENTENVKGGFFGLLSGGFLGGCAPSYNYCAPSYNYCAPKLNFTLPKVVFTVPKVNFCAPKVNYVAPKGSWWC